MAPKAAANEPPPKARSGLVGLSAPKRAGLQMMGMNKLTEPTPKTIIKYSERTDNRDTFLINP